MYKPKNKKVKAASTNKRLRGILIAVIVIFLIIIFRIGWLQFIEGSELKEMMYDQLIKSEILTPKRGTIYDSTGKTLAISAQVDTVSVTPSSFIQKDEDGNIDDFKTKAYREKVAKSLSDIFELEYEDTLNKISSDNSFVIIAKKVEKDKVDRLREWMKKEEIYTGINIDEDTKRYYPYDNLASSLIGFCNDDNQGSEGLEYYWNSTLTGTSGRIVTSTDAISGLIPDENQTYIAPQNGSDLTLTIDANIQSIAEKYLKQGCIENEASRGGNVIIMDPNTGDILAMATYPDYNLNEPYTAYTDELKGIWDTTDQAEKTKSLQAVWRNRAITDTYEPGSTFKTITASASLEEGLVTDIDKQGQFCCTGGIEVAGVRIKCWRYYRPHGAESLRQALMNSCNPIFIGLGQKMGVHTYYSYLQKFGLLEKTGIDLPGEAGSIFLAENKAGPVELATISFGQRFEITPIQLVTAVSSIANGGNLIQPRVVKSIIDSETGEKTDVETKIKSQTISKETSEKVLSMMESVVAEGTGKNAKVAGYRIGGKTGTSEDGVNTNKYVTSFLGVAPIENPQVVLLVTLYNPTGEGGHQGGGVAAPVGGQVFSEILPYLEVTQGNQDEVEQVEQVQVPNVEGLSVKEAEKVTKDVGLEISVQNDSEELDRENTIVTSQSPMEGVNVNKGSKIFVQY